MEFTPREGFRLGVICPGADAAVIDTIVSPKVVAACAVWVPKETTVKTYVWGEPLTGIERGAVVPLCDRTLAIEAR